MGEVERKRPDTVAGLVRGGIARRFDVIEDQKKDARIAELEATIERIVKAVENRAGLAEAENSGDDRGSLWLDCEELVWAKALELVKAERSKP